MQVPSCESSPLCMQSSPWERFSESNAMLSVSKTFFIVLEECASNNTASVRAETQCLSNLASQLLLLIHGTFPLCTFVAPPSIAHDPWLVHSEQRGRRFQRVCLIYFLFCHCRTILTSMSSQIGTCFAQSLPLKARSVSWCSREYLTGLCVPHLLYFTLSATFGIQLKVSDHRFAESLFALRRRQ